VRRSAAQSQQFAHYLQDLVVVREADDAGPGGHRPTATMARSAMIRDLDNRAAHLLPLLRSRPSVVITDRVCL
jgi:hypothetical protein